MEGKNIKATTFIILVAIACPFVLAQDLSGVWSCDNGGTFYFHQIGNTIWLLGEDKPSNPDWTDVAKGNIDKDIISLEWADVPKGKFNSEGTLILRIISGDALQTISATGGFSGSKWTRNNAPNTKKPLPPPIKPKISAKPSVGPLLDTSFGSIQDTSSGSITEISAIASPIASEKPSANVVMMWSFAEECCPDDTVCQNTESPPRVSTIMAFMDDGTWGTIPHRNENYKDEKPSKAEGKWKRDGNQFWWRSDLTGKEHNLDWDESKMVGQDDGCYFMTRKI
jgi:hypothetical protein